MEKIKTTSQKITPFLWFDTNAEEAAKFYTSVFKESGIDLIAYYPEGSPAPAGSVMTVSFHLGEEKFIGLNAGPAFKFSEAISFMVACETQQELDFLWDKLCEGGNESECGWLKDKFGLSWQIVPAKLFEMMQSDDPQKSARMLHALWKMKKLDIATLQKAYDG